MDSWARSLMAEKPSCTRLNFSPTILPNRITPTVSTGRGLMDSRARRGFWASRMTRMAMVMKKPSTKDTRAMPVAMRMAFMSLVMWAMRSPVLLFP